METDPMTIPVVIPNSWNRPIAAAGNNRRVRALHQPLMNLRMSVRKGKTASSIMVGGRHVAPCGVHIGSVLASIVVAVVDGIGMLVKKGEYGGGLGDAAQF